MKFKYITIFLPLFFLIGFYAHAEISYTNFVIDFDVLPDGSCGYETVREKLSIIEHGNFFMGFVAAHNGHQSNSNIISIISKGGENLKCNGTVLDTSEQLQDPSVVIDNNLIYLYAEVEDNHIDLYISPLYGEFNFVFDSRICSNCASPVVFDDGSRWRMLYERMDVNPKSVNHMTSNDLINWTDQGFLYVGNDDTVPDSVVEDLQIPGLFHIYDHEEFSSGRWPVHHSTTSDWQTLQSREIILPDQWNSLHAMSTVDGQILGYVWDMVNGGIYRADGIYVPPPEPGDTVYHYPGTIICDGATSYDTGLLDGFENVTIIATVKGDPPSYGSWSGPLYWEDNGNFCFSGKINEFIGSASIQVGRDWYAASFGEILQDVPYRLALTYDGETLKSFKDGVLISTNQDPSGPASREGLALKICSSAKGSLVYWGNSEVSDIKVFDYALPDNEIINN